MPTDTTGMTPAEIRRAAHAAIIRELGPEGYLRFLHAQTPPRGDYTRDRWNILSDNESLDEFFAELKVAGAEYRKQGLIP